MLGTIVIVGGILITLAWLLSHLFKNRTPEEEIRHIQSQSRGVGIIRGTIATHRANVNTGVNNARTAQITSIHNLDLAPLRLEWERLQQEAAHQNYMIVADAASASRTDIPTYNRLKEIEGTAQVEVLKAQQLKQIDYEYLEKEHELERQGATYLQLYQPGQLEELMRRLELLERRRFEIETGDDPPELKQRLLQICDKGMEFLGGMMENNGSNRLLQEDNGQDASGTLSLAKTRRDH